MMIEQIEGEELAGRFVIESLLYEDRGCVHYTALDRQTNTSVLATVSKKVFTLGGREAHQFLQRFDYFELIRPKVREIIDTGFSNAGHAFVVTDKIDGKLVNADLTLWDEIERRWLLCVRTVDRLHNQGLACGDLSHQSFLLTRNGGFALVSILGSLGEVETEVVDFLGYRSPEQWDDGSSPFSSDVFALGVLGYYMMTGRFPYRHKKVQSPQWNLSKLKPISRYRPECPEWLEPIVLQCLHPEPAHRYDDVSILRTTIDNSRQMAIRSEQAPAQTSRAVTVTRSKAVVSTSQDLTVLDKSKLRLSPNSLKVLVGVSAFAVVLLILTFLVTSRQSSKDLAPTNPQSREELIAAATALDSQQVLNIDRLRDSDDPLSHHLLVEMTKGQTEPIFVRYIRDAILDRAWRKGMSRSVKIVRESFVQLQSFKDYDQLVLLGLEVLDPSLPTTDRSDIFDGIKALAPAYAMQLQVAGGLDLSDHELFRGTLLDAYQSDPRFENDKLEFLSTVALLFGHAELAAAFPDDLTRFRDKLEDKDVTWVLKQLALRNAPDTRAVANLALERNVLDKTRRFFLELVRDQGDGFTSRQLSALVRAAAGGYLPDDLRLFGNSYNVDSTNILLAVVADAKDPETVLEAFDLLAGKNVEIETAIGLLEWIKANAWEDRKALAKLVGQFAYIDMVKPADLREQFKSLDSFIGTKELLNVILANPAAKIVLMAVDRYAGVMPLVQKLGLLRHKDPSVRKAIIKHIDTNEVGALRFIKQAYEVEKDPEVRALYSKFWVVQ